MNRAIVTGATGAIGTALVKELVSQGVKVLVLTRKQSQRNDKIIQNDLVSLRYCSLEELSDLENSEQIECDVFYHLAWTGTTGAGRNDKALQDQNVVYALEAVKCAKRFNCKKFIGVGSQAEYGRKETALTPWMECNPENEYGRAKLEASIKTRELAKKLGMGHNWVRVLSVYGPNDGQNSLISYAVRTLKNKEMPELTKGEQIWDYLYSEDAARALYLVGEKGIDGKIYVLGSGTARPLRQYIETIRDIISSETEIGFGKKAYPDKQVMFLKADISDLTKDTGWKPEIEFEEGIKRVSDAF